MAWTEITRRQYARRTARYASDMTDREWALVEPFVPMPRRLGRPRTTDLREVVNALFNAVFEESDEEWDSTPEKDEFNLYN